MTHTWAHLRAKRVSWKYAERPDGVDLFPFLVSHLVVCIVYKAKQRRTEKVAKDSDDFIPHGSPACFAPCPRAASTYRHCLSPWQAWNRLVYRHSKRTHAEWFKCFDIFPSSIFRAHPHHSHGFTNPVFLQLIVVFMRCNVMLPSNNTFIEIATCHNNWKSSEAALASPLQPVFLFVNLAFALASLI